MVALDVKNVAPPLLAECVVDPKDWQQVRFDHFFCVVAEPVGNAVTGGVLSCLLGLVIVVANRSGQGACAERGRGKSFVNAGECQYCF